MLNLNLSKKDIVELAKLAENKYLQSPCGYLDQLSIVFSKSDHLMLINFKNLQIEYIPFKKNNLKFLIIDSSTKHSIANSEYSKRIEEMESIKYILHKKINKDFNNITVKSNKNKYNTFQSKISINNLYIVYFIENFILKDLSDNIKNKIFIKNINNKNNSLKEFNNFIINNYALHFNKTLLKRLFHFTGEVYRTLKFFTLLRKNKILTKNICNLLNATHISLSQYYEVSIPQIEYIYEFLNIHPAVYCIRIMGGGFGGSLVSVIDYEYFKNNNNYFYFNNYKKNYYFVKRLNIIDKINKLKFFKTSSGENNTFYPFIYNKKFYNLKNYLEFLQEEYLKKFNISLNYYFIDISDGIKNI